MSLSLPTRLSTLSLFPYLPVHPSIHIFPLPTCPSVLPSLPCISLALPLPLSIPASIHPSLHSHLLLPTHLSISFSFPIHPSIHPHLPSLPVRPSIPPSHLLVPTSPFVHPPPSPSPHPSLPTFLPPHVRLSVSLSLSAPVSLSPPDFTAVVPETPRLDSSLQKARARLLAKGRRHRPSRSRLRDSASSTEGDEGPEAAEGLAGTPSPKSCHSSDSSPGFARRDAWPQRHSEDDSRDMSPPEPASPTVGLDKKTRRKFLDLGVTLRRASSSKSRKEKGSNRLSMGSREAAEGPGRSSGSPFLPFSWFSDSARGSASPGSASPAGSPWHEGLSPAKSASQDSTLSEDSPPPSASPRLPGPTATKCSYPYHTLSQSSDEFLDEPPGAAAGWTCRQVGQWLESLNLEQYVEEFSAHGVDGPRLLHLDGAKLKALGVGSSQDRAVLKRKLKELSLAVEKERKAQEKAEKQREKQKKRDQEQRRS
ncbi:sterile alpha motif domain-containing protein 14 isoform 1-T1 [Morphnus guianensis]